MGSTKAKWRAGQLAFYDGATHETVEPMSPIIMMDDFFGTALNGDIWTLINAGGGSTAQAASVLTCDGVVAGATDENGIYGSDDKAWNADKGFIFEARLAVTQAPTVGTEIMIGVQNDNYATGANRVLIADEIAIFAAFGFYTTVGAGLVAQIRTDDGANDSGIITSGVTSVLGTYQIFRMDFTDVSNVLFYIDGVGVATGTTFDMSTGAAVMFQPIVIGQKVGVDAGLVTFALDYVKMWQPTR